MGVKKHKKELTFVEKMLLLYILTEKVPVVLIEEIP